MDPTHEPQPEIAAKLERCVEMGVGMIEPENFSVENVIEDIGRKHGVGKGEKDNEKEKRFPGERFETFLINGEEEPEIEEVKHEEDAIKNLTGERTFKIN